MVSYPPSKGVIQSRTSAWAGHSGSERHPVSQHDERRNRWKMRNEDTTWINFRAVTKPVSLEVPGLCFNNLLENSWQCHLADNWLRRSSPLYTLLKNPTTYSITWIKNLTYSCYPSPSELSGDQLWTQPQISAHPRAIAGLGWVQGLCHRSVGPTTGRNPGGRHKKV